MADGAANKKQKDQAMAQYMKAHPGQFPDSEMRPHNGVGSDARKMAMTMGRSTRTTTRWLIGVLGGVMAHKKGFPMPKQFAEFLD